MEFISDAICLLMDAIVWIFKTPKACGVLMILSGIALCFIEVEPGIRDATYTPVFVGLGLFLIFAKDPYGTHRND